MSRPSNLNEDWDESLDAEECVDDADMREEARHKASELMRQKGFVPDELEGGWIKKREAFWVEACLEGTGEYLRLDYYPSSTGMKTFSASFSLCESDDAPIEKILALFEV